MPPHGILNLNKPAGISSRRVVDLAARLARPAKTGHAGTLDPLATGVLVVCIGGATRLIEYVQRMPKRYVGTFLLGHSSPTEDVEGDVAELPDAPIPTPEQIAAAVAGFVGRIAQRPPAFSALKVKGRPAYKLAREGRPVSFPPRPVEIYRIEVKAYDYPELTLEVECGSGTYIRSLGRDIAESLGTAAVMSALVRTAVGRFRIEQSADPNVLNSSNWTGWLQPPLAAVDGLARIQLTAEEVSRVRAGQSIEPRGGSDGYIPMETPPQLVDQPSLFDSLGATAGLSSSAGNTAGQASSGTRHFRSVGALERGGNLTETKRVKELAALDPAGRLVAVLVGDGAGRWRPRLNLPDM